MIIRIVRATCDAHLCDATLEIPPTDPQPFVFIDRHHWSTRLDDNILTYCPAHKEFSDGHRP